MFLHGTSPRRSPRDMALLIEMVLAFDDKIDRLEAIIATLNGLVYGVRSERLVAIVKEQLTLDLADVAAATPVAANDDKVGAAAPKSPRSPTKPKRNIGALPKHLPRVEEVIEPETTICQCCAGKLHRIGKDVAEALDRIPEVLRVLRTIRPKYACRSCEGTIVQAKARPRLIESGMASTGIDTLTLGARAEAGCGLTQAAAAVALFQTLWASPRNCRSVGRQSRCR